MGAFLFINALDLQILELCDSLGKYAEIEEKAGFNKKEPGAR